MHTYAPASCETSAGRPKAEIADTIASLGSVEKSFSSPPCTTGSSLGAYPALSSIAAFIRFFASASGVTALLPPACPSIITASGETPSSSASAISAACPNSTGSRSFRISAPPMTQGIRSNASCVGLTESSPKGRKAVTRTVFIGRQSPTSSASSPFFAVGLLSP